MNPRKQNHAVAGNISNLYPLKSENPLNFRRNKI